MSSKEPKKRKHEQETDRKIKPKTEELKDVNKLEERIGESPFTVEFVASYIKSTNNDDTGLPEQDLELLNKIKEKRDVLLLSAAKYGKKTAVDFFIKIGVNVNVTDDHGDLAADYAFREGNKEILLLLLKADSFFPAQFKVSDDDGELKNFVDGRNRLHEVIEHGTVDEVQLHIDKGGKVHLNTANESAVYLALKKKKFNTYAYLKSIGAEFGIGIGKQNEKSVLHRLTRTEKVCLQEAMVQYFPSASDSHIYYLVSKSRSQKYLPNLTDTLMGYYEKLSEIPEVSIVLKVVQYAEYLDVIFDFDEGDVSKICPLEKSRGETIYSLKRIYVAAGVQTEKEVLGTVAHELTHMAMEMLYENQCNPYRKTDEDCVKFFNNFKTRIQKDIKKNDFDPSKILMDAMDCYKPVDHDAELIVRIPHILAQFKDGKVWLEKYVPELWNFYKNDVEEKCKEFINQSVILQPMSIIKSMNESVGEIMTLKKCCVYFDNVSNILDERKPILLVKSENTLLGTLKILQGIYGKRYKDSYNHFLILKFENFIIRQGEIMRIFFLEASSLMLIEIENKPKISELYRTFHAISDLLKKKPDRKIVLVAHETISEFIRRILEDKLKNLFTEKSVEGLSLAQLDAESQTKILNRSVYFQGKPQPLQNLIQPDLYKFIDTETLQSLLEDEKVQIGTEILGLSSLEGAFSDVMQEINFVSFLLEVQKDLKEIFILRSNLRYDVLKSHLTKYFNEKLINVEFFTKKNYDLEWKTITEKILLVNELFESKNFKKFTKINFEQKSYFIDLRNLQTNHLFLREFYNPDFYVSRKMRKILMTPKQLKDFVEFTRQENFVISSETDYKKDEFKKFDNIQWLSLEEARKAFEENRGFHWFHSENEMFFWKNSNCSVENLQLYLKELKQDDHDDVWIEDSNREGCFYVDDGESDPKEIRIEDCLLTEERLITEIIYKKIVLIADSPGMGKTTTLTKLCEMEAITQGHWIIRINLRDSIEAIRERIDGRDLDPEKIIRFFTEIDPNLQDEFTKNLLRTLLTTKNQFPKTLLIAFDGFDELLDDDDRGNVLKLVKFLKIETPSKVWITTRLQYAEDLEENLETLALTFYPFDEEAKKLFIEKYLKDRFKLMLDQNSFLEFFSDDENSKMSKFTQALLSKTNLIFKGYATKFVGTPLQLNLVILGSIEYFKIWITDNNLDFSYLGDNILNVYENFVDKKYKSYFQKHKTELIQRKRQNKDKINSEKYNRKLADSLIYDKKMLKPKEEDKEIFLLIGLIQSQNDENFEFIHFTFREFYFALVLTERIEMFLSQRLNFVIEEIFVKREYEMVRNFLNFLLQNISEENLEKLKSNVVSKEVVIGPYTTVDSVLTVSVEEGHDNIFNFFYSIYKAYETTNILNRCLFCASAIGGTLQSWEAKFKIMNNVRFTEKWEVFYCKYLIFESARLAAELKNSKLFKFLMGKIESIFSRNDIRHFWTVMNAKHDTFRRIVEKHYAPGVFDTVLSISGTIIPKNYQYKFLLMPNLYGPNALFAAATKNDPKFIDLLFQKTETIMNIEEQRQVVWMRDDSDRTILHRAVEKSSLDTCELILDYAKNILEPEELSEFLTAEDNDQQTVLHYSVERNQKNLLEFLIKKGEEILTDSETLHEYITIGSAERNQTILHLAVNIGRFELLEFIFEQAERILPKDDFIQWLMIKDEYAGSVIHLACLQGNRKILEFVLAKMENILGNHEFQQLIIAANATGQTPLHYVASKNNLDMLELLFQKYEEHLSPDNRKKLILMEDINGGTACHDAYCQNQSSVIRYLMEKRHILIPEMNSEDIYKILYSVVFSGPADVVEFVWSKMEEYLSEEDKDKLLSTNFPEMLLAATFNADSKVISLLFDKMDENLNEEQQKECFFITDEDNQTYIHSIYRYGPAKYAIMFLDKMIEILEAEEIFPLLTHMPNNDLKYAGNTVLHLAAKKATDQVDLLLKKTQKILTIEQQYEMLVIPNLNGKSVLNSIRASAPVDFVQSMLNRAEKFLTIAEQIMFLMGSGEKKTLIHKAVKSNKPDLVRLLLEKCERILDPEDALGFVTRKVNSSLKPDRYFIKTESYPNTILHLAAFSGDRGIMKLLLEFMDKKISIEHQKQLLIEKNGENQTALHLILCSFHSSKIQALQLLLMKMKEILTPQDLKELLIHQDDVYGSVLHTAAMINEPEIVQIILNFVGKNLKAELCQLFTAVDQNSGSLLHAAVLNDDPKIVKLILKEGKKILPPDELFEFLSATDKFGRTVLHLAAGDEEPKSRWGQRGNQFSLVRETKRDKYLSLLKDRSELVYSFLKKASVMTAEKRCRFLMMKDDKGRTALHVAVEESKFEVVKLLLQERKIILFEENSNDFLNEVGAENCRAFEISHRTGNYFIKNLLTIFIEN